MRGKNVVNCYPHNITEIERTECFAHESIVNPVIWESPSPSFEEKKIQFVDSTCCSYCQMVGGLKQESCLACQIATPSNLFKTTSTSLREEENQNNWLFRHDQAYFLQNPSNVVEYDTLGGVAGLFGKIPNYLDSPGTAKARTSEEWHETTPKEIHFLEKAFWPTETLPVFYSVPSVIPNLSFAHTSFVETSLPHSVREGTGEPQSVPHSFLQSIRSWFVTFFQKNPAIKREMRWNGIATRSWDPVQYDIFDDSSMRQEAWQELLSYMWTIENLYEYYGFIRSFKPTFDLRTIPPSLDLPFSVTNENRVVNEVHARRFFLAYLAHSLVLEKHKLVPWSLSDYIPANNLAYLLRSDTFYSNTKDSSGRVSPSDPTELFLWMVYQGWLQFSHGNPPRFDNTKRTELRDNLLRWCGNMLRHTGGEMSQTLRTPGYPLLQKADGTAFSPEDYFYQGYWGTPRLPPLVRILAGHCISYDGFRMKTSFGIASFEAPPGPMSRSTQQPIKSFMLRAYQGCWAGARILTYLFRVVNIPAYFTENTFLPEHASFVLPAEPHPHMPDPWILVHADDAFSLDVKLVNPLYPAPMSRIFRSWSAFVRDMTNPSDPSSISSTFFPNDPRQFQLPATTSDLLKYKNQLDKIETQRFSNIRKQYPTLDTIVGTFALYGLLNSSSIRSGSLYRGPHTTWLYQGRDLHFSLSPTQLGQNMPTDLMYREKQLWELAHDLGTIISILSKAQVQTGSFDTKSNAEYYWSLYDLAQSHLFMPPSYSNPILNKNFSLHCA